MKNLHNEIATFLTGKAGIKEVKVYNRQPERPEEHKLFKSPTVFVEFQVQRIENLTNWEQLWSVNVSLHVTVKRKDGDKPDVYDVPTAVMALMSGINFEETVTVDGAPETRAITRYGFHPTDWQVDHEHDNVVDNILTFQTVYYFNNNPVQNALTAWAQVAGITFEQTI
jgi:hypothetical protein